MCGGGSEPGGIALKLRALVIVALTIVGSGCGAATASPSPVVGQGSLGPFRLELELSRPEWHHNEPIPGEATLSLVGMDTLTYGSTGTGITFRFEEVGGNREFVEPSTADCKGRTLEAGKPFVVPITFSDPTYSLPVGTWRISASAPVNANGICPNAALGATVEGHVTP